MPEFADHATSTAPPEEVWKVLYDPSRIPEWWAGIATAEPGDDGVTIYAEGYPDFPMPQLMTSSPEDRTVRFSCQVSDMNIEWRLVPRGDGGTEISVDVEIPEREAHRLDTQRAEMGESIRRLATVAAARPA
jgi:uncharacterized protein YndB with AHSA1/START domain